MSILTSRFIKFCGMAGILALSVSALQAENSGFYGAVGFQYSNMTKATGSNSGSPTGPLFLPGQNAYSTQTLDGTITPLGQSGNSGVVSVTPLANQKLPTP
ncbi:hypothetical protein [Helicobacter salomonis]|uniref:hypothetical protein n=1 Tax=Helicobacter salomonis TaxID=56878 RepID=UPI0013158D18|nr:hypothetical protein [Helicobacter salomonis]